MTNPNEPVYPIQDCSRNFIPGLTKREEFAKAAMQGLLADPDIIETSISAIAELAVSHADALIEALNKGKSGCKLCGNGNAQYYGDFQGPLCYDCWSKHMEDKATLNKEGK